MAERRSKSGRVRVVRQQERQASEPTAKEAILDSSKEEPIATPEGYRFTEEVTGSAADNLVAEDAPKARVEGQQVNAKLEPPTLDLSKDSLSLANLTLGSVNGFVVMMFGQECQLYDGEKRLLYPSLARVINRMPAASAAKAAVFVDPVVLLLGLAIWGNRIIAIKSKQRTEANAVTAREFAAASGISWDSQRQQAPREEPNVSAPGQAGNGAGTVYPEASPNTANANGVVGKVPDAIIDSGTNDINGPG